MTRMCGHNTTKPHLHFCSFAATLLPMIMLGCCLLEEAMSANGKSKKMDQIIESAKKPPGYCEAAIKISYGPPVCPSIGPLPMYYKEESDACCVFCAPAIRIPNKERKKRKGEDNDKAEDLEAEKGKESDKDKKEDAEKEIKNGGLDYRCPSDEFLTWFVEDYKICCGSERIGKKGVSDWSGLAGSTELGWRGREHENCRDLIGPGKTKSDCPRAKMLCKSELWAEVMREQCPYTCGLCGRGIIQKSEGWPKIKNLAGWTYEAGGRPGSREECRDGTNASGTSQCPSFHFRCKDLDWEGFMSEECPFTCETCKNKKTGIDDFR